MLINNAYMRCHPQLLFCFPLLPPILINVCTRRCPLGRRIKRYKRDPSTTLHDVCIWRKQCSLTHMDGCCIRIRRPVIVRRLVPVVPPAAPAQHKSQHTVTLKHCNV
eukprot:scaffold10859_cov95-Skeletonema_dohrnii-CCMP3373.AAC.8